MTFLSILKLTLLTVLLVGPKTVSCENHAKVVIVGAGPSGIAAATTLYKNNIIDILILEAEDRIGGRIYTQPFGNATVELGAEFCHGAEGNVVFELAHKLLKPTLKGIQFYHSSGDYMDQAFLNSVYKDLGNIYGRKGEVNDNNVSIEDYLDERFKEEILVKYNNQTVKDYVKGVYQYYTRYLAGHEGAFSLDDVPAMSCYTDCEGNQYYTWKEGGYHTILDILLQKYPDPEKELPLKNKILLNKEVSDIVWDNLESRETGDVIIKCSDDSVYTADHVIFTASLGVLKNNHQKLFLPNLPDEKIKAINMLGIADVSKIYINFSNKWWPDDEFTNFRLIWTEEDKELLLKEFPYGPVKEGRSWLEDIVDFKGVQNSSVLIAWIGGEFALDIECLEDSLIIDGIWHVLNKFLSQEYPEITKPVAILRNKWYSHPHFQGAYSFETMESKLDKVSFHEVLSQPLTSNNKPVVLFGGEATHDIYYSTVHGAIETGYREANRIIKLYN